MDYTKKSPVILSLCPGMLGLERGFERAATRLGWKPHRIEAFVEIEAFICWNLVKQMEQGVLAPAITWTDIKTFDGKPFQNKIDFLFGGYPCQPFSVAGERKGTEDERHLFPHIARIIESVRPVCCFFENVAGHLTMGFPEVYASLRNMGYSVEAGIYSAEEVGAPHRRERLFILAISNTHLQRWGKQWKLGGSYAAGTRNEFNGSGEEVEHTNGNGYDGSQNRESNIEGENRSAPRQNEFVKSSGPSNTGECGKVGNASSQGFKIPGLPGEWKFCKETESGVHNRFKQSGINVVNSCKLRFDNEQKECGKPGNDEERFFKIKEPLRTNEQCGISEPGDVLSDTSINRGEARLSEQEQREEGKSGEFNNSCNKFPARPGEEQYEWEAPRIESSLGFTVDGYNFREDLLRMAGNGVVEQTAEIAFIDLLNKFYK